MVNILLSNPDVSQIFKNMMIGYNFVSPELLRNLDLQREKKLYKKRKCIKFGPAGNYLSYNCVNYKPPPNMIITPKQIILTDYSKFKDELSSFNPKYLPISWAQNVFFTLGVNRQNVSQCFKKIEPVDFKKYRNLYG